MGVGFSVYVGGYAVSASAFVCVFVCLCALFLLDNVDDEKNHEKRPHGNPCAFGTQEVLICFG